MDFEDLPVDIVEVILSSFHELLNKSCRALLDGTTRKTYYIQSIRGTCKAMIQIACASRSYHDFIFSRNEDIWQHVFLSLLQTNVIDNNCDGLTSVGNVIPYSRGVLLAMGRGCQFCIFNPNMRKVLWSMGGNGKGCRICTECLYERTICDFNILSPIQRKSTNARVHEILSNEVSCLPSTIGTSYNRSFGQSTHVFVWRDDAVDCLQKIIDTCAELNPLDVVLLEVVKENARYKPNADRVTRQAKMLDEMKHNRELWREIHAKASRYLPPSVLPFAKMKQLEMSTSMPVDPRKILFDAIWKKVVNGWITDADDIVTIVHPTAAQSFFDDDGLQEGVARALDSHISEIVDHILDGSLQKFNKKWYMSWESLRRLRESLKSIKSDALERHRYNVVRNLTRVMFRNVSERNMWYEIDMERLLEKCRVPKYTFDKLTYNQKMELITAMRSQQPRCTKCQRNFKRFTDMAHHIRDSQLHRS